MQTLSVAIGAYPHTQALKAGEVASDLFALDFPEIKPVNRAFAPMARERRFDVSEMAIATVLQAIAYGVEIALLPIAMASRFQESALFVRADSPLKTPGGSAPAGASACAPTARPPACGCAASCTRASAWSRPTSNGPPSRARMSPPMPIRRSSQRAAPGQDLLTMLREGELDAAIVGADVPDDPGLRLLFPEPIKAAGEAFFVRHGFVPINHMVVVKTELALQPGVASELCRLFAESKARGADAGARPRADRPLRRRRLRAARRRICVPAGPDADGCCPKTKSGATPPSDWA